MQIPYYMSKRTSNSLIIFDFVPWTVFSGSVAYDQMKGFVSIIQFNLRADCLFVFENDKGKYKDLCEENVEFLRNIAHGYDNILLSGPISTKIFLSDKVVKTNKKNVTTTTYKAKVSKFSDGAYEIFFQNYDNHLIRMGLTQYPKFWSAYTIDNLFNILGADLDLVRLGTQEYANREPAWEEVHSLKELQLVLNIDKYPETEPFAFDLETTGLGPWAYYYPDDDYSPGKGKPQKIISCSVCIDANDKGYSFLVEHPVIPSRYKGEGLKMLKWLMSLPNPKIAHNAKFEYIWTEKYYNIPIVGQLRDTQLLSHLLHECLGKGTGRYSLAGTVALHLKKVPHKGDFLDSINTGIKRTNMGALSDIVEINGTGKDSTREDILGLKKLAEMKEKPEIRDKDFTKFSREELHQYGSYDAQATKQAYDEIVRQLNNIDIERATLGNRPIRDGKKILFYLQDRMTRTLGTMEYNGMPCDTDMILTIIDQCALDIEENERKLNASCGKHIVQWGSTQSVSNYLRECYPQLQGILTETSRGDFQLDKAALKLIQAQPEKHAWVEHLLAYRHAQKARSTYMTAFYRFATENRLHFSFNIDGTATGRLSSDRPNMQNIPKKIAGTPIKRVLLPEKGQVLYNLDLATAEVRMLANYSGDVNLIKALSTGGLDLHAYTGSIISPYTYDDITGARKREKIPGVVLTEDEKKALGWRQSAKCVTFGTIYGMTAKKLAEDLDVTIEEAEEIIAGFYRAYPQVESWIKAVQNDAYRFGYVETIFGRRRNFKVLTLLEEYMPKSSFFMIQRVYRQAVNYLIQGTTSDFFQLLLFDLMSIPGLTLHITVHDSVVFSLDETKTSVKELYKYCDDIFIEKPKKIFKDFLKVDMNYDLGRGFTYGDVTDLDRGKIFSDAIEVIPNGELIDKSKKEDKPEISESKTPAPKRRLIRRKVI